MAINKRAEIQLNGIKSGIPVSPTTPTPLSPSTPLSTSVHAPQLAHTNRKQYRPDQNSSLKWSWFSAHAPTPGQLSYLCARQIGNWGFRIVVGMSEHYNRITSTKPSTCYTPINWYELRHMHCKKSQLNKSRRGCLRTIKEIKSFLIIPKSKIIKISLTLNGLTSEFEIWSSCNFMENSSLFFLTSFFFSLQIQQFNVIFLNIKLLERLVQVVIQKID